MKKYEYVSLHIGKLFGSKSKDHKQIIDEYAKKGYRTETSPATESVDKILMRLNQPFTYYYYIKVDKNLTLVFYKKN